MAILVINSGSSSLKLSLFKGGPGAPSAVESNTPLKPFWSKKLEGGELDELPALISSLGKKETAPDAIQCVGHRVVHGGTKYSTSTILNDQVIEDLKGCIELAPAHEAANIKAIEQARSVLPQATHIAVFDTSYHYNMPLESQVYALPWTWYEDMGIRRYGFHGINHQYCVEELAKISAPQAARRKVITCHLGSGGSLCASLDGRSLMTTMGYTPLEGLVMRGRSGSIDPGIILLFMQKHKFSADQLSAILNQESGLKGISGLSGDMRELEKEMDGGHKRARLAFDVYIQSLAAHVASLVTYLGGLDVLIFTGGIGENSPRVRSAVSERLAFLNLHLDKSKNENPNLNLRPETAGAGADISANNSAVRTYVMAAGEEAAIARECRNLLSHDPV